MFVISSIILGNATNDEQLLLAYYFTYASIELITEIQFCHQYFKKSFLILFVYFVMRVYLCGDIQ